VNGLCLDLREVVSAKTGGAIGDGDGWGLYGFGCL